MSTRRQRRAAARLAKVAQGPVTPEPNRVQGTHAEEAIRAGLAIPFTSRLSHTVVLTIESHEEFNALHELYCHEHHPATPGEHLIIEEMTVTRWRLQRAWLNESCLLENQMDQMTGELEQKYKTMDNGTRLSLAYRKLSEQTPALALVERQINSLTRQLDQCVKRLENLRRARFATYSQQSEILNVRNDPNPNNEHLQTAPEPVESTGPAADSRDQNPIRPENPADSRPSELVVLRPGPERHDSDPLPGARGALPRAA